MNTELDTLELRVQSEAQSAAAGLDKLIAALTQMKSAARGGAGLTATAAGLDKLNTALSKLNNNRKSLGALKSALSGLSGVKTNLTTTANQLNKLNAAMGDLKVEDTKIQALTDSLSKLGSLQKATGLNSTINALKKIPEVTKLLKATDLDAFAVQIQKVVTAMAPLATAMDKVSRGFSSFPTRIQRVLKSTNSLTSANQKAARSFSVLSDPVTGLAAKLASYEYLLRSVVGVLADCVTSINDYVENVNLFQVAMGEYYDEAYNYAQLVSDKLGVDPSQWMRTQGVFMSMANGFGLASDKAYALSEGLTELSYDISSLYNEDIETSAQRLQSALAGEIEPIRRLGISISEATLKEYALALGIDESVESMTEQEKAMLRALKLMEGASQLGAIGDFARTLESPANAIRVLQQQLVQLARAIGSVLLPIIIQVLPYVQAFVEILTGAISALASLFGFEMPTWSASDWGAADWGDGITSGATDAADALGGATAAAKELKNATLGIDELNILAPNSGGSGGSGGGAGGGLGSDWVNDLEIPNIWDQEALKEIQSKADKIKAIIESNLAQLQVIVSGAALVIGAILTLTGANIPVGLALMAIGAAGLVSAITTNWGAMSTTLQGVLTSILGMLGGFFLVLGAILVFSGANIPIGIALMALGVASLAAAVAVNWGSLNGVLSAALTALTGIIGGALLAIGAVFAFSGANLPLGIGLMIAGAAAVGSAVALNWSAMDPNLQNAVAGITTIISGAFLALGAILTFSGANPVLGIGLLASGAAILATTVVLNWDSMNTQVSQSITKITSVVGAAFLALGAVLTFSGANPALGIGLMAAGAVSLATAAALNWSTIVTTVTSTLKSVGAAVGVSLLALGAILCLSGVALPLGIGLLAAGGVSLASAVALNWDEIVNTVGSTLSSIGSKFMAFASEWLSVEKWQELGKQAINGLFKGLSNIWGNVKSWGQGLLSDVKNALGIHSPSVRFEEIGEYSIAGLSKGFAGVSEITSQLQDQLTIMRGYAEDFSTHALDLITNTNSQYRTMLSNAVTYTQSCTTSMANSFVSMASRSTSAIQSITSALNAIPRNITTTNTIVTKSTGSSGSVKAYASGGFPDRGQLFIANEEAPELVGNIGRQTAVANNDQIVSGIASGVSEANEPLISAVYAAAQQVIRAVEAGGDIYLDGYKVGQRVTSSQNRQNRVYGKTLQNV